MSKSSFRKELNKIMKVESYELIREKNHYIWKHTQYGNRIVTPTSPRNEWRSLKNIRGEIRRVHHMNDNLPNYRNDNRPNK